VYNITEGFSLNSYPFDRRFKTFYLPNLLESLLSVPRTWLSFTIFIYIIGFDYIGEILLVQMILGLFIFVCNSFVLNAYEKINCDNLNSRTSSLKLGLKPIVLLSTTMVIVTILFWDSIKQIINLDQINDLQILILCAATIIQAFLLPLGAIFKKYGLSKLTLQHNMLFLILFISLEYIFLVEFGEIGYYWAYSLSWGIVFCTMFYQAIKYKVCSPFCIIKYLCPILFGYGLAYHLIGGF